MQAIFDWLSSVLALLLCASVVDMLLSDSPMKKYVRLAAGLVIMAALINPLFSADWSFSFFNEQSTSSFQLETKQQLNQLSDVSELASNTYVNQQLHSDAKMAAASFSSCEVLDVGAEMNGEDLKNIQVLVKGTCPEEKIRNVLTENWNIEDHQLNMVMEKEELGGG
ncbi:stage III sporulation protein AF [Domibacillus sp. A3M-37]|uniref:stage III sporulation protein AF n=1 Tax=Domibacillus TaxID=1433999 RepID=UPI0006180C1F|nr:MULTISPECIES: stage III sporulation protein AF [Domibacillus]MCP3763294.1 stage III sporulation protein AF [Domibacillus sp. A3M-37]